MRRLPLLSTASAANLHANGPPRAIARRRRVDAIGIADTLDGEWALRFGRALASALAARGVGTASTVLAFSASGAAGSEPAAHAQKEPARFVATLAHRAIDPEAEGEALPELAPAEGVIALLLGVPALASFDPALAILLGAERPLGLWPAALRTHRAHYQLALGAERPGIAVALAALLAASLVLPGR